MTDVSDVERAHYNGHEDIGLTERQQIDLLLCQLRWEQQRVRQLEQAAKALDAQLVQSMPESRGRDQFLQYILDYPEHFGTRAAEIRLSERVLGAAGRGLRV